jgi:2-keto-4-pentenoate hydratase
MEQPFDVETLAAALLAARTSLQPVPRPPAMSKEQATEVKRRGIALHCGNGQRVVGYKVSMSYTWGALTDADVFAGPATLRRGDFFDPLIETEAVFHLERDISPNDTIDDVVKHSKVSAGFEIADSRWQGWRPSTGDHATMGVPTRAEIEADNALSGCLVLGSERVPATALPLPDVTVTALRDGRSVASGSLTVVMGHPAQVVLWLASELAAIGETLRAGQLVSTGNPYRDLLTVPAGGTAYEMEIPGVGSNRVTFI